MSIAAAMRASSRRDVLRLQRRRCRLQLQQKPLQTVTTRRFYNAGMTGVFDAKAPDEPKIFESGNVIKTEMTKKLKEIQHRAIGGK